MSCKLFCMKTKLLLFIVNYFLVILVWPTCMRPVSQNAFDAPDTACISIVVILSSCSKQKYLLSYSWPAGSWWTLSWPWFLVWRTPASWTPLHLKHSERGVSGDMRSLWISIGQNVTGSRRRWRLTDVWRPDEICLRPDKHLRDALTGRRREAAALKPTFRDKGDATPAESVLRVSESRLRRSPFKMHFVRDG